MRRPVCPECGREFDWHDIPEPERPLGWRVHLVDLVGLFAIVGINTLMVGAVAVATIFFNRGSWFNAPRWQWGRHPDSISSVTLYVLGASLLGWGAAWQFGSWESWRWQKLAAAWCAIITLFHLVGCLSLWF